VIDDRFYMSLALKEAWKYQALTYPNPPVGALILDKNGKILSIEAHERAGEAHAELKALERAFYSLTKDKTILQLKDPNLKHSYILKNHNDIFRDFTIYVTLEPCMHQGKTPACSILLKELGFKRVVIGSLDPNLKAKGGGEYLRGFGIEVKEGVLKEECEVLIEPFKKWQKGESFVFFKLAQTQNGVIEGGIISSLESRKLVHKIREKIDLLVIGGNTVRIDRPTLDCRLIDSKKAPDVLIYTQDPSSIDRNIPLFKVKNREVFVESSLNKIRSYRFVMVEGGEGMLKALKDEIDWLLLFVSPKFVENINIKSEISLKRLNFSLIDNDILIWNKIINDS